MREEVRRQLPPGSENAEQVLMAVQEELLNELLNNETGLEVGSRLLQESDFAEAKENLLKERESSVSHSEEWQEKRFLRLFGLFTMHCLGMYNSLFQVLGSSR